MSYILPYANLAVSWGLFILIWLVQIIIYPGFHKIPREAFVAYHRWYVIRISFIVLPLMVAELALSVGWLLSDNFSPVSALLCFFVFIVWLSTFVLQVPIHNRLKTAKEDKLIRCLVETNWVRTAAWSIKTGIVSMDTINGIF
jgi:hypothetical protein